VLQSIYGSDTETVASQEGRYRRALEVFRQTYGPGPVSVFRAPGRVNLIGEHTDYAQGYVLPAALDRDLLLIARARPDGQVHLANVEPGFEPSRFALTPEIPSAPRGHWSNYARGAAQMLAADYAASVGVDALICGQAPWGIPRGAGLASSSALTVAMALALAVANRLPLAGADLAEACSRAEWYVGTRGGIMDHFASLLARRSAALFLDCRPDRVTGTYSWRYVPLPDDVALVVIDSGQRHCNTTPLYNTRVAEVQAGAALLSRRYPQVTHLRDAERLSWDACEELLPERMTVAELEARGVSLPVLLKAGIIPDDTTLCIRARCRHVITENARVLEAATALEAHDLKRLGALLSCAHASLRDDFAASTPEIEVLVELASHSPGVVGARLTGAGWGGCIIALASRPGAAACVEEICRRYGEQTGLQADAFVCSSGPGACHLMDLHV